MDLFKAINDRSFVGYKTNEDIATFLIPYFSLKREYIKEDSLEGCYFCLKYNPTGELLATTRGFYNFY